MRVLITGATGFVGGWLTERLLAETVWRVMAFSRGGKWPDPLAHLSNVPLGNGDCADPESIRRVVASFQPQAIVHLAGMTSPGQSFKDPSAAWHDNLGGARGLLTGIAEAGIKPLVLHVGTGLVYAPPSGGESLSEDAPLGPASPYAAWTGCAAIQPSPSRIRFIETVSGFRFRASPKRPSAFGST